MAMLTSKGCNTQGVEADENAVNIAREHGLSVTNGVFNKEMFTDQRFDWILMDQVIEHLEDPIESLANCARILSPNGTIIVACPRAHSLTRNIFGRRWIHWHTPYHRHFFSRKSMEIAAAKASLKMQTHETNTKSNWVLYQMLHPILFGGHGRKSVMWDNRINRGIPAKIIQKSLTGAIKTLNLHKLLAHQISSSGRGDNSIFILRCI
jgi:predicted SAM-dependent methyltransferase